MAVKPWNEMTGDERAASCLAAMREDAKRYEHGPRPANEREGECWDLLTDNGFFSSKRGWPDFLCQAEGTNGQTVVFAVEVKRHPEDEPTPAQLAAMSTLECAGIPCFIWDRHLGFRRAGSRCQDGLGKQPWDKEFNNPSLPRCGLCYGQGVGFATDTIPPECPRCGGSGLAPTKLTEVK